MFDLFVLQNTNRRRVGQQFEAKPAPRQPAQRQEPKRPQQRRTALLTALRPSRATADR